MLLDQIIDLLSDQKHSLTEILLKTKVLLADFDDPQLEAWVNSELNGYSDDAQLPDYRVLHPQLMGTVMAGYLRYPRHPLPTLHIEEEWIERLGIWKSYFRFGLARIEALIAGDGNAAATPLPIECNAMLSKGLDDCYVEKAWMEIDKTQIEGIPAQIRSRLLDFMLKLRKKVGKGTPDAEVKERAAGVDLGALLTNSVFSGQTNIFVGQGHSQVIHQTVNKGDIAGLVAALKALGVDNSELKALEVAVTKDAQKLGAPSIEGETGKWYSGLLGKAARGALGVGVDVVSSTATKIFFAYMGMPVP